MIRLRPLEPASAAGPLLELWNGALGSHFPLDERLWLQQLRMETDEALLLGAFEETERRVGEALGASSRLVGAALAKRRRRPEPGGGVPALGNLSFILVAGPWRRRGIGTALLSAAEEWLRERGAETLHLGRDRYHFFPGLPLEAGPGSEALASFLEARGFRLENLEEDLIAELGELDLEALEARAPIAPGYRFALYEEALRPALADFFGRCFPGRWREDSFEALDAGMPGRDLALLVEEASGAVVGFSRIYDPESPVLGPSVYWRGLMGARPGGLGPIGVDEARRGLGLGLGLLRACLAELKRRGVGTMAIDWTDLGPFYEKMGFRTWKRYRMASKELA